MTIRAAVPATVVASLACALALALAVAPAHAGSLTVRDATSAWTVNEDPQADANDFLLRHLVNGTAPDERFGRNGQTAFTLVATNDPPASVRVDSTHRTWMVGAGLAGNQPQPVIARFLADGNADLHWGVQGKLQLTPAGVAVKPNDLLPLADGSVLVAGEVTGVATPRAVVFHLNADGSLDRKFGSGGIWQRAGEDDASTATSLAASSDGLAAVAVSVRGAKPGAELWAMTDVAPVVIQRKPMDDSSDGEDLRVDWVTDHWTLSNGGGPTGVVPPALLTNRAQPPAAAAAASDPGEGGFNPFTAIAASAPAAAPEDDGLPWHWVIVIAAFLLAAGAGVLVLRGGKPKTVLRKPPS
jgi:hypothetical protein